MNYSTLKKTVALSLVSMLAVGIANAQTDSSKAAKPMAMADTGTTTAKVFGGRAQYNTWSVGLNVGITSPSVATGGSMDYTTKKMSLGYGASLRDQLGHNFGLQFDFRGGKVQGDDSGNGLPASFSTNFWQGTISGVVNVATIDYIRRKNAVNFFITAGAGLAFYNPTGVTPGGAPFDFKAATNHEVREYVIPLGAGVKFRLTDQWALNLGYTENFVDGDNFDGRKNPNTPNHKDKYSYGYAGLEYTFGSKSKPSLEWVNPVAMMYDELYDAALRQEVEALKGRVGNVENAINDLKKDADGDGVADQFDKCPNTPAGTVVDGSGCPINFPKIDTSLFMRKPVAGEAKAYSNIQFEFDSSVLRTSSYPTLDLTSSDMRANASQRYELDGFASSEGTAAHNLKLSRDRANSVKTYLVNSGVDSKRLRVKAYGETHPIADNSTEEGRILNRRVEFKKR
jgi:OOP family OmpA-OmpF porin